MKRVQKYFSIVLAVILLLTAAPLSGFVGLEWPELNLPEWTLPDFDFNFLADAAEVVNSGTCGENLTWTLDSDGVLTIAGTGEMENYDYWDNYSPWYSKRSAIETVIIENGVTSIGDYAFSDCTSLTSVTIPDSVTSIGEYAFEECTSLTSVTIPDSVTSIGGSAFEYCPSLTSVTIGDSVTSIGYAAFLECTSLTSVTIPDSVTSIGYDAFSRCTKLTSITIGDSVTSIGYAAFYDCTKLTSVTIPDSVTSIGYRAFYNCPALTIRGYLDSYAQQYAEENDIPFIALNGESTYILGDVDGDNDVTSSDARLALRAAVKLETLTEAQTKAADADKDGEITSSDARLILRAAVGLETL